MSHKRNWTVLPLVLLAGCVERLPVPDGVETATGEIEPVADRPEPNYPIAVVPASRQGEFDQQIQYGAKKLVLNGCGLCEWGFLKFDLYHAALYVERRPENITAALAADQVMVIHLEFVRALDGAQLDQAYTESVRANTGEQFGTFEKPLALLRSSLRAVEPGDAYTFVSDPEIGLIVQRSGRVIRSIEDEQFRRLFVRLYLGDKPPTKALRDALLGGVR